MSDEVRSEDVGTYQMLWDCPACGTSKLLGLTHRHCPACGSPQDPDARYFPSDAEKVAVEDHPLAGRDLQCPACDTPNSSAANNCGGCGSPLADAKEVVVREDVVLGEGERFAGETGADAKAAERARQAAKHPQPQGKPAKTDAARGTRKRRGLIIAGVIALVLLLAFVFTRKREVEIEATSHSWSRTIEVEEFGEVNESAWCERMPARAKLRSKKSEVRETKKVPDGETCKTRKKDMGNGTFKEVRECKTKYRDEKVYADKCYYRIDKWHHERQFEAKGSALTPAPSWPQVELAKTGRGDCRGCQREGARGEAYTVHFAYEDDTDTCEFALSRWESIAIGDRFVAKAGRMTSNLDCDSLVAKE